MQLLQEFDTNKLQQEAQERANADEEQASAAALAGHHPPACATQLHCNRTSAGSNAKLDMHGLVGLVCTHIIPLLALFLPMPTYEQHYYYDVLFMALLAARPDVRFIYLDLACRYYKRFARLIAEKVALGWKVGEVELKLPWMHGMDHDMECQLQHGGLYTSDAGARVGEQSEHLWAGVKAFGKLARYMSLCRWWDGLNLLLWGLTQLRLASFPDLLSQRIGNTKKKQVHYRKVLKDLRAEAAAHGVRDLVAALQDLSSNEAAASEQLSDKARYVMCLIKLKGQDDLHDRKAAVTLALPGSTGVQVHASAVDTAKRAKMVLEKNRAAMGAGLGILEEDWTDEDPRYVAAAAEVRLVKVRQYERQVEEHVFKRKMLQHSLEQAEGGKNDIKLKKRVITERSTIQGLLAVRASWIAYPHTRTDASAFCEEAVNTVCNGEFPWGGGGIGNGSLASREHYGRRYRTAKAHAERYNEEAAYLEKEVIRTANWLEEQETAVSQRMAAVQQHMSATDRADRGAAGQIALLQREQKLLQLFSASFGKLRAG